MGRGASPTGVWHSPHSCPTAADKEAGTVIHQLPLSSAQDCFQYYRLSSEPFLCVQSKLS